LLGPITPHRTARPPHPPPVLLRLVRKAAQRPAAEARRQAVPLPVAVVEERRVAAPLADVHPSAPPFWGCQWVFTITVMVCSRQARGVGHGPLPGPAITSCHRSGGRPQLESLASPAPGAQPQARFLDRATITASSGSVLKTEWAGHFRAEYSQPQ